MKVKEFLKRIQPLIEETPEIEEILTNFNQDIKNNKFFVKEKTFEICNISSIEKYCLNQKCKEITRKILQNVFTISTNSENKRSFEEEKELILQKIEQKSKERTEDIKQYLTEEVTAEYGHQIEIDALRNLNNKTNIIESIWALKKIR